MSDIYIKCVLTIIAGCLLVIVSRDVGFIPEARADVGGKNYRELQQDPDFVEAVKYVAEENCSTAIRGKKTYFYCNDHGSHAPR